MAPEPQSPDLPNRGCQYTPCRPVWQGRAQSLHPADVVSPSEGVAAQASNRGASARASTFNEDASSVIEREPEAGAGISKMHQVRAADLTDNTVTGGRRSELGRGRVHTDLPLRLPVREGR